MPKWLKPLEPAVDALAIINTAPAGPASNVEVFKPGVGPEPIALDLAMRRVSELSHERQQRLRRLLSQHLVLKKLGLLPLSCEEIEEIISRLPV